MLLNFFPLTGLNVLNIFILYHMKRRRNKIPMILIGIAYHHIIISWWIRIPMDPADLDPNHWFLGICWLWNLTLWSVFIISAGLNQGFGSWSYHFAVIRIHIISPWSGSILFHRDPDPYPNTDPDTSNLNHGQIVEIFYLGQKNVKS